MRSHHRWREEEEPSNERQSERERRRSREEKTNKTDRRLFYSTSYLRERKLFFVKDKRILTQTLYKASKENNLRVKESVRKLKSQLNQQITVN